MHDVADLIDKTPSHFIMAKICPCLHLLDLPLYLSLHVVDVFKVVLQQFEGTRHLFCYGFSRDYGFYSFLMGLRCVDVCLKDLKPGP
jgi:hypothetical protein